MVLHLDVGLVLFRERNQPTVLGILAKPGSCLPDSHFASETDPAEWHHPLRYVAMVVTYSLVTTELIPCLDGNISFHKCSWNLPPPTVPIFIANFAAVVAWSIVFFSWVHTVAHWVNFGLLASKQKLGFKGFLLANFKTGPGWSGYVMLLVLMAMVFTSLEKPRRANYERFWYTHHLFIVFFIFWAVHGAFCMIKTDIAPSCRGTGTFWLYWMYGGFIYLLERIMREVRGRHKTFISKVVQHPSRVVEIQIKKERTKTKAGQVFPPFFHRLEAPSSDFLYAPNPLAALSFGV